ncbi:hypothetical protein [Calothrix sp. PCC 7507]|uniref:hypothetical protein n=1 Tax=Calothrix sp. PCC 7507 TaxID=99598 RepID=UPI00029F0760|nr:hypothetical protein [Calothrix sp. PCC 7507]AFY34794.1 hypothetical protein Cal7507_4423 [Calothrix sp. PCC 7507]
MLRRLFILGFGTTVLISSISSSLVAAPSLSKEATTAFLKKAKRVRGNMKIEEALKIMGKPLKQVPRERYIWAGKNYKIFLDFRVFKTGVKFQEIYQSQIPDKFDKPLAELWNKMQSLKPGTPYPEVVKILGSSGAKDKSVNLVEYFWSAKEAVAIVLSINGIVKVANYYDKPQDYANQEYIPRD